MNSHNLLVGCFPCCVCVCVSLSSGASAGSPQCGAVDYAALLTGHHSSLKGKSDSKQGFPAWVVIREQQQNMQ